MGESDNSRSSPVYIKSIFKNPQGIDVKNSLQRHKRCTQGGSGEAFRDIILQERR